MSMVGKPRVVAGLFMAFMIAAGVFLAGSLLMRPYDDGSLSPYNSSGNLNYGGRVAATATYEFVSIPGDGLYRKTTADGTFDKIYGGEVSSVNPVNGWVYYVADGKLIRSDYLGLTIEEMVTGIAVKDMSVNGYWVYFTDTEGNLYKMRRDGSDKRQMETGGIQVVRYTADNRKVIFTALDGIYIMKSDGSGVEKLYDGQYPFFAYSNDNLFYTDGEKVYRRFQLVTDIDGSAYPYREISARVFNYAFDGEGRGLVYYMTPEGLNVRKLYVSEDRPEEDVFVCDIQDVKEIYCAGYNIYCYNTNGEVYHITLDGDYKGTVKKLENLS